MYSIPSAVNLQVFLRLTKYFFFDISRLLAGPGGCSDRGDLDALLGGALGGLLLGAHLGHLAGALHLAVQVEVEEAQHLVGQPQAVLERLDHRAGRLVLPKDVVPLALVLDHVREDALAPHILLDDRRAFLGDQLFDLAEERRALLIVQGCVEDDTEFVQRHGLSFRPSAPASRREQGTRHAWRNRNSRPNAGKSKPTSTPYGAGEGARATDGQAGTPVAPHRGFTPANPDPPIVASALGDLEHPAVRAVAPSDAGVAADAELSVLALRVVAAVLGPHHGPVLGAVHVVADLVDAPELRNPVLGESGRRQHHERARGCEKRCPSHVETSWCAKYRTRERPDVSTRSAGEAPAPR